MQYSHFKVSHHIIGSHPLSLTDIPLDQNLPDLHPLSLFIHSTVIPISFSFSYFLFFSENNDPSLFEADIRLLSEQRFALVTTGDIDARIGVKRGITNEQERLWPGGIIPYNITDDLRKICVFIKLGNTFKSCIIDYVDKLQRLVFILS